MGERWLVAEQDPDDPLMWWYGLADSPNAKLVLMGAGGTNSKTVLDLRGPDTK